MSTRERIIEEALALFAENGYDGTGVERIAERVGIKAPSLYKHLKGKVYEDSGGHDGERAAEGR